MLTEKNHIRFLSTLCFLVYFASYVTRINFGAIVAEIVSTEGLLKTSVSFVITAGFISYGLGQLISGIIGDIIDPKKMIFWGLISTSVFNFSIPFFKSVIPMAVIWTLNGFAQSAMWPPLVRVMSTYFSKDEFRKNCITVSVASSAGTISVYLFAPVIIHFFNWKMVLVASGVVSLVIAFIWINGMKRIVHFSKNIVQEEKETARTERPAAYISYYNLIISSGLIFIIIGVISQGIVKDSVSTWMPSYISETFNVEASLSILSAVVLPVFSALSVKIAGDLHKKVFKNELTCASVIFLAALSALVVMVFFGTRSVWLSIALASIVTGCMHGVNLMLISLIPLQFNRFGNVSSVSGMLNFFAYIGSALSMYGIARLTELYGWQLTVFAWTLITVIGLVACLLCIRPWRGFSKRS